MKGSGGGVRESVMGGIVGNSEIGGIPAIMAALSKASTGAIALHTKN